MLFIGGMCFAGTGESTALVSVSDSAMLADSIAYYESMASRLKQEGDSLLNVATENIGTGIVVTVLGGLAVGYCSSTMKGGSLEGGGLAGAFLVVPSAALLIGGVIGIVSGVSQSVKGKKKIEQSEEQSKLAEKYRTNRLQVKVDFVPMVNPFGKSVGGMLALNF